MDDKKESVVVRMTLEQDTVNSVDKMASEIGIKSHRLMGNLIGIGLDEIKALKRYGILEKGIFVVSLLEQYGLLEKKKRGEFKRPMGVSIRISKELDEEVGRLADELGKPKNGLTVLCLNTGLDAVQTFRDVGLFQIGVGITKFEVAVRELFTEKRTKEIWGKRFAMAREVSKEMLRNVRL